jgi:hypothetical protein
MKPLPSLPSHEMLFRAFDDGQMVYSASFRSLGLFFSAIREDAVVMRGIGRKYKGTKEEIYEGDIVEGENQYKGILWQVAYRSDSEFTGFLPYEKRNECPGDYNPLSRFISWDSVVKRGSIYETPELIKSPASNE